MRQLQRASAPHRPHIPRAAVARCVAAALIPCWRLGDMRCSHCPVQTVGASERVGSHMHGAATYVHAQQQGLKLASPRTSAPRGLASGAGPHVRSVAAAVGAGQRGLQLAPGARRHVLQRAGAADRLAAPGHRDVGLVGHAADPAGRAIAHDLRPAPASTELWSTQHPDIGGTHAPPCLCIRRVTVPLHAPLKDSRVGAAGLRHARRPTHRHHWPHIRSSTSMGFASSARRMRALRGAHAG